MNQLLNGATLRATIPLKLTTDPGSRVPTGSGKELTDKVNILYRNDGTESKPDGILQGVYDTQFLIVVDAKFYSDNIPKEVIEKTLDDMNLRKTDYGILICSENTKRTLFDNIPDKKGLKLLILKPSEGENPCSPYTDEYLTTEN